VRTILLAVFSLTIASGQNWTPQDSGTSVSLRGISAAGKDVVWAGGAKGTYLRTLDGGAHWEMRTMAKAADLDFRDVQGFDDRTAVLMSAGKGPLSRLYRTRDGGESWSLVMTNPDAEGFWDEMAFWDATYGILVGDPVDGRFTIMTTSDGGQTWNREKGPVAQKEEGIFAASGSGIVVRGTRDVWFGTGGPAGARVLHSSDGGKSWSASKVPMKAGASAGVFSLAYSDAFHLMAVGGDYKAEKETAGTLAVSLDGGKNWKEASGLSGYRSSIVYVPESKQWVAVGPSGTDVSDDGVTWRAIPGGFHALGAREGVVWGVGAGGMIGKFALR
jgi:photosystem II stability/assembly factor-like uncharacterized protein